MSFFTFVTDFIRMLFYSSFHFVSDIFILILGVYLTFHLEVNLSSYYSASSEISLYYTRSITEMESRREIWLKCAYPI